MMTERTQRRMEQRKQRSKREESMKYTKIGRVVMVFGLGALINLAAISCGPAMANVVDDVDRMADAADQFLMSLSDQERARAAWTFEDEERLRFHFVPR